MNLVIIVCLFLLGIVLIVKGGDFFVDAASWIAQVSGVPKLIIGATIVSLATTMPEMLVSLMASLQEKVDMSIGNAVGSVTANIGLIMAISLIFMPAAIRRRDYLPKSVLMMAAALIIVIGGFKGELTRPLSIALLAIFVVFIFENINSARRSMTEEIPAKAKIQRIRPDKKEITTNLLKFILGAVGIVIGANLLVDNGSELARLVGVSERIIGVTIVAIGTSLPELVTTITAIVKNQSSLSVGNILGANILDLSLILPLCNVVSGKPLPISPASALIDLPACFIVGFIALVPALITARFRRWQGALLLMVYASYVVITCGFTGA
ncbi:MAG: calcium/sodium antiporter [Hungatella sp.]|jgi:cation:H+ antiporter|nr:calcium/sodium antiporter [Hungatella sp.]